MNKRKKILPTAILLTALTSLTSCHRGVGCPNNFSVNDLMETIINTAQQVIVYFI